MGEAIAQLGWRRDSFIVSSKVFFGGAKPTQRGLSAKHVTEACHAALKRLRGDYLDLFFCHRPDLDTPIEETVRAMHNLVNSGQGSLLGHVRMDRAAADRGLGHRARPRPHAALDGAAAVQPLRAQQGRARIRAAIPPDGPWYGHLVAARLGPTHRKIFQRHPRRQPHEPPGLRVAEGAERDRAGPQADRRRDQSSAR